MKVNTPLLIILGFVVLSLTLATATVVISHRAGMTDGYIPPEERAPIERPE